MRPPECGVCGKGPDEADGGMEAFTTVAFADYEPLPDRMTGHPRGLEWLCGDHAAAGAALAQLSWPEAYRRLRGRG